MLGVSKSQRQHPPSLVAFYLMSCLFYAFFFNTLSKVPVNFFSFVLHISLILQQR